MRRSSASQPVEPRGDQRVQRLGHLERLDLAGQAVHVALAYEQPAVEEHPHGLDRVERHALGALEDALAELVGEARDGPGEERRHRVGRERLEGDRREVALAGPQVGRRSGELGPARA